MSMNSIPDERASFVRKSLANGKTRAEVAVLLGYKTWRSLDIYMRRTGARWDSGRNTYVYDYEDGSGNLKRYGANCNITGANTKITSIISKFSSADADPMKIAKECGFRDHRELSAYMAARGYRWSTDNSNYYKAPLRLMENESGNIVSGEDAISPEGNSLENPSSGNSFLKTEGTGMKKYLDFIDILYKNREKLLEFLTPGTAPGSIPRYTIPGITRTKSFYMSDRLSGLVAEFSDIMNISQKEVIEAAVIEFLKRYSFKNEVDTILGQK